MSLRATWKQFIGREPGKRFQQEYTRHNAKGRAPWKRVLGIVAGVVIIAVGIVALPAPGPGWLVIGIGAGLLARESQRIARWLDGAEVKLRGWVKKVKR